MPNDILSCSWNQDYTFLAVGSEQGFRIYKSHPFALCYSKETDPVQIVEMLHATSLIALVQLVPKSPRMLRLVDVKTDSIIAELYFPSSIFHVRLTSDRLVVLLDKQLFLYSLNDLHLLNILQTSTCLPTAVTVDRRYMAFPNKVNAGNCDIVNMEDADVVALIKAHSTEVSCIALHPNGKLIATSSKKGTVIKVFTVPEGNLICLLRRGYKHASVNALAFHPDLAFLASVSENGTVHIYRLPETSGKHGLNAEVPKVHSTSNSWSKSLSSRLARISEAQRDFATARIPETTFAGSIYFYGPSSQIHIASLSGHYYCFSVNYSSGGSCPLIHQFSFQA